MPKFPKGFGRRKSTANAFEDLENLPAVAEPSFKVFERPAGGSRSFDGGIKLTTGTPGRPLTSPKHKEDSIFADVKGNRGSGGSNTNTISTIDNSSRLSAASTAPSSTHETNPNEDWKSPHDKPLHDIPMPPVLKASNAFSLKNAGRTLSWGRNKPATPSPSLKPQDHSQSPGGSTSQIEGESSGRQRNFTASSYASTATPPRLEERDLGFTLGEGFDSDMFAGIGKRKSAILEGEDLRGMSASPEYYPSRPTPPPAVRSYPSRPSPLHIDRKRDVEPSPYSWSSQHSHDGLMAQQASSPPPVPVHASQQPRSIDSLPSAVPRPQRPGVIADVGVRRSSAFSARRQSTLSYGDSVDEDARLLRESVNASRQLGEEKGRESWTDRASPDYTTRKYENVGSDSAEPTPRARKVQPEPKPETHDEGLFEHAIDPQVAEAANIALQFEEKPISPPVQTTSQMKVMTPAQFERYKQDQERLRSVGGGVKDEDEEENYEEEEDETEKNRQLAKQRRKQEAHMAVYRQQMMKMTGEALALKPDLAIQSTPNLLMNGKPEEGEEEDEEVPLAILAAHGFPNKNKPPNPQLNSMGSNSNLRAAAQSAGNAGGNLPVFARHLPQDPYLGAGLVHPSNRESLAFGNGNGSLHGSPARHLPPPGGLVGVIATEERSRAMRRGSPNTTGDFGGMPGNGFNGMGVGAPGMMQGMNPMGQPMMLTPGDQAQIQMTQQMQQFMQMQMQFMQMMTSGPAMQQQQQPPQNGVQPRPVSSHLQPGTPNLRPSSYHQGQPRTMSMLEPSSAPWMQGGQLFAPSMQNQGAGYAPSIAPSERSNIGLPGRYRPVSHLPVSENKSRTSTMSGALQNWENKNGSATIKQVRKMKSASDEDDEEGWAEMKAKRDKKKSMWRSKKEDNGLKEMVNYAQ